MALAGAFRLNRNQNSVNSSLLKLSTGRKINSGRDGPAALIASERLSAEIKALEAESRSQERVHSNATITDGHVGQLSAQMSELKGLLISSANSGAMSDAEIAANQLQIDSIVTSIEGITGNAVSSLDGVNLPDNGNAQVQSQLTSARDAVRSLRSGGVNSLSSGNFEAAMTALDGALSGVSSSRGTIGSYQRYTIEPQIRSNQVTLTNLFDSRSRIADTDFATETANLTRSQILTSVSTKLLKIAQNQTASILDLFA